MSETKSYVIKQNPVAVFEFDLKEARDLYEAIPLQNGKGALGAFENALSEALDELEEI